MSASPTSDQVHYLHSGTVRSKLIVLKPESTFNSEADKRHQTSNNHNQHSNHNHDNSTLIQTLPTQQPQLHLDDTLTEERKYSYPCSELSHLHGHHLFPENRYNTSKKASKSRDKCPRKLCLCLATAIVSVLLGVAAGVYLGFRILENGESNRGTEFRGVFHVIAGDNYTTDLSDPFSPEFRNRAKNYKRKLDSIFNNSVLRKAYLGSKILAIDPINVDNPNNLKIRFNLRIDSSKVHVDAGDVYLIVANEVLHDSSEVMSGIEVDPDSIEIHERRSGHDSGGVEQPDATVHQVVMLQPRRNRNNLKRQKTNTTISQPSNMENTTTKLTITQVSSVTPITEIPEETGESPHGSETHTVIEVPPPQIPEINETTTTTIQDTTQLSTTPIPVPIPVDILSPNPTEEIINEEVTTMAHIRRHRHRHRSTVKPPEQIPDMLPPMIDDFSQREEPNPKDEVLAGVSEMPISQQLVNTSQVNPEGSSSVVDVARPDQALADIPDSLQETTVAPIARNQAQQVGILGLVTPVQRKCVPVELGVCSGLPHNLTSYPNLLGHLSAAEADAFFHVIRGTLDSDCYEFAYYFMCHLLQPVCSNNQLILPCRNLCHGFLEKCNFFIPEPLFYLFACDNFPEETSNIHCVKSPNCVHELHTRGKEYLMCDGVLDCADSSDEKQCSWCSMDQFYCGRSQCVNNTKRCDGRADCVNGADERNCVTVAASLAEANEIAPYNKEGFVFLGDKGSVGKICAETLNRVTSERRKEVVLRNVGISACQLLGYKNVDFVEVRPDPEGLGNYFHIRNPYSWRVTFLESPCESKQVIYVGCSNFECGTRPAKTPLKLIVHTDHTKVISLPNHGDWPWHTMLYNNGLHSCDATLIAEQWLITTATCFQGLPGGRWTARLGTVRLGSDSPYQQRRRVINKVHSPIKGSDLVLVKLEKPVKLTDFVRPACIPLTDESFINGKKCVTLGWDITKNQLRETSVVLTETEECVWRWPIGKMHVFCTTDPYGQMNDCRGEDQTGSPLLCERNGTWNLIGVVNWRIGCGLAKQPRLYDKVSINTEWILRTIENHSKPTTERSSNSTQVV